jgi:lysophospholipase L1-like esterase
MKAATTITITRVNMLFFNTTPPTVHHSRARNVAANTALVIVSLLLSLLAIEAGYRMFDPFPYISQNDFNHTEYGNLSEYDQLLGWRGVPSAQAEFVTVNSRTWLRNNRYGFRDIEHRETPPAKPAIVFLGDSFTWGYEVEFDEMFVNILREKLPEFELYNLSHRGYGTDQELLTFKNWNHSGPVARVILMVSENDLEDNNSAIGSSKPKPMFQLINGKLVLTGTPVPRQDDWATPEQFEKFPESWKTRCLEFLLRSHFVHDVGNRILIHIQKIDMNPASASNPAPRELILTGRILEELKKEVSRRNAELIVFFIPSKREIERLDSSPPYQTPLAELCARLHIRHYDLAPDFKGSWLRSYYRQGMHWNPHGNKVAARAILRYLNAQ